MFREIRRSEKNLLPVKKVEIENVAIKTIKPKTDITVDEARNFINSLFG